MALVAGAPACALPWPFVSHAPKITRESTRLGDWQLDIARNLFSGAIACRLSSLDHKAFYRASAVGFRFRSTWDVGQAVYRLDHGEPLTFRDDLPELVARGAPLDRGGLDHPTGGIVWVPFERLTNANSIAIAPRPDRSATTFHVRGLAALREIALARGCTPESRFLER